jgi:hypothetical protein
MKTSWARLDQLEQDLRRRHQELSKNNYFALSVKAQEREDALRKGMTPIADAMEFQRRFDKTPERKAHLQAVSQLGRTQEAIQRLERDILEELAFVHSGNKKAQIALQLLKEPQNGAAFLRIVARLRASRSAKARKRRQGAKREHVSRPEALRDQKPSLAKGSVQQSADPVPVVPEAGSRVPRVAPDGVPSPMPGLATPGEIKVPQAPDRPSAVESKGPAGDPEDRLSHFMQEHPGTTYADIKYSAKVHTPEFQDWRKGKLKPNSVMTGRIEKVLSETTALTKKPSKRRTI